MSKNHRPNQQQNQTYASNPSAGLSSGANARFCRAALRASGPAQIDALLADVGYRPPPSIAVTVQERDRAIEQEIVRFVAGAEGQRLVMAQRDQMIRAAAADWIKSEAGQRELTRLLAADLATLLRDDAGAIDRACGEAVRAKVERWLRSPLGQAQIERRQADESKRLAAQARADAEKATPKVSWLDQ